MRIGKRLQYYRIDQTKDRRIGADTEAQDEHRSDAETGRLQKQAYRVAKLGHGGRER